MSGDTEKRKRNGERNWIPLVGILISLVVLLGAIASVYSDSKSQDARQDVKIEHNTDALEDLKTVPADVSGIKATLDAQQSTLERMDTTLRDIHAKSK